MTWQIKLPFRDRNEPLLDALSSVPRALEGEDRMVAQQAMLGAMLDGAETVGDLLDALEDASPPERRAMLDEARVAGGLPTTEAADVRKAMTATSRVLAQKPLRDEAGFAFLICAAEGCAAHPVDQVTGAPAKVDVRRWWCEAHRDLAPQGDMDRWTSGLRYSASGALEFADQVEAERRRQEREQERFRAKREMQAAERAVEAEDARRDDDALAEHFRPKGAGWDQ